MPKDVVRVRRARLCLVEYLIDDLLVRVVDVKAWVDTVRSPRSADPSLGREYLSARDAGVRVVREAPIPLPKVLLGSTCPLHSDHDVAALVGHIGTDERGDRDLLGAAVLGVAEADVDIRAFEVVLQNEIDYAADGVGAVYGRGTPRDHLDARDCGRRNRIRVDDHRRIDRHRALTVDENEVSIRTEAAQADRRCADRVGGRLLRIERRELRDGRNELRQLIQNRLDADRARLFERGLGDRRNR